MNAAETVVAEPVGVGQSHRGTHATHAAHAGHMHRGMYRGGGVSGLIEIARPTSGCSKWLIAYVDGMSFPAVVLRGPGFSYARALQSFGGTRFFTFNGFLFATDVVNGVRVIKICIDGLHVAHIGNGRFKVTHPRGRGMGAAPPLNPFQTLVQGADAQNFVPLYAVGTDPSGASFDSYVQVYPKDAGGVVAGTNLGGGVFTQGTVGNLVNAVSSRFPKNPASGHIYFAIHDPTSGAPQTVGLPDGVAFYRFRYDASGPILAILSPQGFSTTPPVVAAAAPTAGSTVNEFEITTNGGTPYSSFQSAAPNGPGLFWNNYCWTYVGSAPTSYPPGQVASPAGIYGRWALVGSVGGLPAWLWFGVTTAAITAQYGNTAFGLYVGGDGQTYVGFGRARDAAAGIMNIATPTAPPPWLVGASGQWVQPYPGVEFWVWVNSMATTNLNWLWILIGVVAAGGAAYYIFD